MNARTLATLAALAIIVIGAAVWMSIAHHHADTPTALLYPSLKTQLDKVQSIRITGAGDHKSVELERKDGSWRVSERSGYPASDDKVRALLIDVSEAKVLEQKTSLPANYPALGVEDVSAGTATGARVQLGGINGVDLIIGKNGGGVNLRYVRKAGEAPSWLVDRSLDAPTDPKGWLDTRLLDIAPERIQSAHIEVQGKQTFTAAKSKTGDANFAVSDLKKRQTLSTDTAANGVGPALAALTLVDVAPIAQSQGKTPQAKATYKTFDGWVFELTGWIDGTTHWLGVRAQYEKDVPANDKPSNHAQAEATALDRRLSAWAFQIPEYKYAAIFPAVEDLLKK